MDLEEAARLAKEFLYRKLAHGHFVERMGLPNPRMISSISRCHRSSIAVPDLLTGNYPL